MCTLCTCSPAACRPPVRAAGTSGHHTLSPSLHCGRPPPCPPKDCLRPPDAPPHLKDRRRRLTYYTKLGQCLPSTLQRCQCPASFLFLLDTNRKWHLFLAMYLYKGCRRPLHPPYGHSCAPPTGHEDTDPRTVRFRSTSQHPAGSDQNPVQSGPRTRPWPHPCTHIHTIQFGLLPFRHLPVTRDHPISCHFWLQPLKRSYRISHLIYSNMALVTGTKGRKRMYDNSVDIF